MNISTKKDSLTNCAKQLILNDYVWKLINLTLKLRKTLIEAVKSRHQNLFIVGLYWYHDVNNLEEVYKITSKRVFERGEHHQSRIPDIPEYEHLMWSFLRSFEPLDSNHGIDGQFNLVIELKIAINLSPKIKYLICTILKF
ncbi:13037_t:CDS:2 [Entrophospora sp. SA101]|nr:13037_t:CDS:2 [Entrophospora sp. SA101]